MGILSGLAKMGLGRFESAELFEKKEEPPKKEVVEEVKKKEIDERDYILEKTFECPVCFKSFKDSKVKANKARLIRQDKDLRPVYADIDKGKYDITSCPYCGYSALDKNFSTIAPPQAKLIKEQISRSFRSFKRYFVISYDEALERYRLAIANCIVKKGKASEKAFLCLKMAWTIRGYIEEYEKNGLDNTEKVQELKNDEEELIGNAVEGFVSARATESFPIAGMDTVTLDYLLAVLCLRQGNLDDAGRYLMSVLQNRNASSRIKNNTLELKAEIIEKKHNM